MNIFLETKNKKIVPDQTAPLGLFCVYMLFMSEEFGSGMQRIKNP